MQAVMRPQIICHDYGRKMLVTMVDILIRNLRVQLKS